MILNLHQIMRLLGLGAKNLLAEGSTREEALQQAAEALYASIDPGRATSGWQAVSAILPSFCLAWADSGFAMVEVSHKLAASMMSTSITKEAANALKLPWRCFCIDIPNGLLPDHAPEHLLVLQRHDGIVTILEISPTYLGIGFEGSLGEYADRQLLKRDEEVSDMDIESAFLEDHDLQVRLTNLLGRFLVGTIVEMSQPRMIKRSKGIHGSNIKMKRGEPKSWVVKLGRPVKLDVRQEVKEYAAGTSRRVTVQVLVRGHWKRQRCGDGGSQRKWIHIEPYWRGPEEAPILVRSHQIGD